MQHYRALLFGLVIMAFATVGMASDIAIHMDPAQMPQQAGNFNLIQSASTQYQVNWVTCNQPAFPSSNPPGYNACIGLLNQTGVELTSIDISFTVPSGSPLVNQTLACATDGTNFTSNTCPNGTTLGAGDVVNAAFYGGQPIPNNNVFFIGEIGVNLSDMANVPLIVSASPEPGMLLLFSTGLGMLALGWHRKRRQARLTHSQLYQRP